jgi:hypothetical protein
MSIAVTLAASNGPSGIDLNGNGPSKISITPCESNDKEKARDNVLRPEEIINVSKWLQNFDFKVDDDDDDDLQADEDLLGSVDLSKRPASSMQNLLD